MPKIHATSRTLHFPSGKENNTYTVRLEFTLTVQLQALKCSTEGEDSFIIHKMFEDREMLVMLVFKLQLTDFFFKSKPSNLCDVISKILIVKLCECTPSLYPQLCLLQSIIIFPNLEYPF